MTDIRDTHTVPILLKRRTEKEKESYLEGYAAGARCAKTLVDRLRGNQMYPPVEEADMGLPEGRRRYTGGDLMNEIHKAFVPHLAMRDVMPHPPGREPAPLTKEEEAMWALHTKVQQIALGAYNRAIRGPNAQ